MLKGYRSIRLWNGKQGIVIQRTDYMSSSFFFLLLRWCPFAGEVVCSVKMFIFYCMACKLCYQTSENIVEDVNLS